VSQLVRLDSLIAGTRVRIAVQPYYGFILTDQRHGGDPIVYEETDRQNEQVWFGEWLVEVLDAPLPSIHTAHTPPTAPTRRATPAPTSTESRLALLQRLQREVAALEAEQAG
jgi:hypothetical protein